MTWRKTLSWAKPSLEIIKGKRDIGELKVEYPKEHKPFMESDKGFSCSVCEYFRKGKTDKEFYCSNEYYKKWKGSNELDIEDPKKACSDWFEPEGSKKDKDNKDW